MEEGRFDITLLKNTEYNTYSLVNRNFPEKTVL